MTPSARLPLPMISVGCMADGGPEATPLPWPAGEAALAHDGRFQIWPPSAVQQETFLKNKNLKFGS